MSPKLRESGLVRCRSGCAGHAPLTAILDRRDAIAADSSQHFGRASGKLVQIRAPTDPFPLPALNGGRFGSPLWPLSEVLRNYPERRLLEVALEWTHNDIARFEIARCNKG